MPGISAQSSPCMGGSIEDKAGDMQLAKGELSIHRDADSLFAFFAVTAIRWLLA